jgi:uncharacterized protein YndB with AHSA1/START domain
MENGGNKKAELTIQRAFNAKKEIVFNAFAEAEALAEWWGPPGVPITIIKHEFTPNGIFHYKATMQGQTSYGKFVYGQISNYDLLEFTSSFTDENANTIRAPFHDQFPLEIFNRLVFTELDGKTTITLTGYPIHATADELSFFTAMKDNMQQGFAGTFAQLENYLSGRLHP